MTVFFPLSLRQQKLNDTQGYFPQEAMSKSRGITVVYGLSVKFIYFLIDHHLFPNSQWSIHSTTHPSIYLLDL